MLLCLECVVEGQTTLCVTEPVCAFLRGGQECVLFCWVVHGRTRGSQEQTGYNYQTEVCWLRPFKCAQLVFERCQLERLWKDCVVQTHRHEPARIFATHAYMPKRTPWLLHTCNSHQVHTSIRTLLPITHDCAATKRWLCAVTCALPRRCQMLPR